MLLNALTRIFYCCTIDLRERYACTRQPSIESVQRISLEAIRCTIYLPVDEIVVKYICKRKDFGYIISVFRLVVVDST